jgi:hypothetical protein
MTSCRFADQVPLRDRLAIAVPVKTRSPKRSPLAKESDIQVTFNWNKLDLVAPPEVLAAFTPLQA